MTVSVECPFCFEIFEIESYPEDGLNQKIIYDCEVCCHPIDLTITFDEEGESAVAAAEKSDGF